jgi:GNAT superfamily N-acetyltransferase
MFLVCMVYLLIFSLSLSAAQISIVEGNYACHREGIAKILEGRVQVNDGGELWKYSDITCEPEELEAVLKGTKSSHSAREKIFVAVNSGDLTVGFATIQRESLAPSWWSKLLFYRKKQGEYSLFIREIGIHQDYRGQGIGYRLFNKVVEYAQQDVSIKEVTITAGAYNKRAQEAYSKWTEGKHPRIAARGALEYVKLVHQPQWGYKQYAYGAIPFIGILAMSYCLSVRCFPS